MGSSNTGSARHLSTTTSIVPRCSKLCIVKSCKACAFPVTNGSELVDSRPYIPLKEIVTNAELLKPPFLAQIRSILKLLFFLPDTEVNLRMPPRHRAIWDLQIPAVAVTLVLAVHVHKHSQAGCNITIRPQMDTECSRHWGYGNISLDEAIRVCRAILFQRYLRTCPLYGASKLLECRHIDACKEISDQIGTPARLSNAQV